MKLLVGGLLIGLCCCLGAAGLTASGAAGLTASGAAGLTASGAAGLTASGAAGLTASGSGQINLCYELTTPGYELTTPGAGQTISGSGQINSVKILVKGQNLAFNGTGTNLAATAYDPKSPDRFIQHWQIVPNTEGSDAIVNSVTLRCVQIDGKCERLQNIITAPCNSEEYQKWVFKENGYIVPACDESLVLHVQFKHNDNVYLGLASNNKILKYFDVTPAM